MQTEYSKSLQNWAQGRTDEQLRVLLESPEKFTDEEYAALTLEEVRRKGGDVSSITPA